MMLYDMLWYALFKLITGQDDRAMMFSDDYLIQSGCLYLGCGFIHRVMYFSICIVFDSEVGN